MEAVNVLENIEFDENKPVLRTLLAGPGSRVMRLCLRAGQTLPEHAAPDAITVQTLSGRVTFYDGPAPLEMTAGMLIRLAARRPHALTAQENSVLLVTILSPSVQPPVMPSPEASLLDLRSIPREQRHPLVFARLGALAVGESFTIANDHDPQPLRKQLEARFPDESTWDYIERGPDLFRIRIGRAQPAKN